MRLSRAALLAVAALGATAAGQAAAQIPPGAWPRCVEARDGQQIGLGGSVCECRQARGGTMIGRPSGWRWSCDLLKSDGSQLGIPADAPSHRRELPPGYGYPPQGDAGSLAGPLDPRLSDPRLSDPRLSDPRLSERPSYQRGPGPGYGYPFPGGAGPGGPIEPGPFSPLYRP